MKRFLVALVLGFVLVGCNLPGGSTPTPIPTMVPSGGRRPAPTATIVFGAASAPTTAPTQSFALVVTPTKAAAAAGVKYDCDPNGIKVEDIQVGEAVKPGHKYNFVYPGKSKSGLGVWFWIAKQYGVAIPDSDMKINSSKYSQAYLYWLSSPSDPKSIFDWAAYNADKEVAFVFYLPE